MCRDRGSGGAVSEWTGHGSGAGTEGLIASDCYVACCRGMSALAESYARVMSQLGGRQAADSVLDAADAASPVEAVESVTR